MNETDARYVELVNELAAANQQYESACSNADYTTLEHAYRSRVFIHDSFNLVQNLLDEYQRLLPKVSYEIFNEYPKPY